MESPAGGRVFASPSPAEAGASGYPGLEQDEDEKQRADDDLGPPGVEGPPKLMKV
jgi:hypothetical protein